MTWDCRSGFPMMVATPSTACTTTAHLSKYGFQHTRDGRNTHESRFSQSSAGSDSVRLLPVQGRGSEAVEHRAGGELSISLARERVEGTQMDTRDQHGEKPMVLPFGFLPGGVEQAKRWRCYRRCCHDGKPDALGCGEDRKS